MAEQGTAEIVSLRAKWRHETDFSRWLAKNITELNQYIDEWKIDPDSVRREVSAWNATLYIDLLCDARKGDSDESFRVIIENQFDGTDMDHFSRFMQYITAFDAQGAIWIAGDIYEEYVQVIQWLNDNAEIDAYLFTIHLEGNNKSCAVPVLTPIAGPRLPRREWKPNYTPAGDVARWYARVLPKVAEKCKQYNVWQGIFPTAGAWRRQDVQHEDLRIRRFIKWYINVFPNRTNIGVYIPNSPRVESYYYFEQLEDRKEEVNDAFGEKLRWRKTGAGGFKYITRQIPVKAGYRCDDTDLLEKEADAVADAMASLIAATKGPISELTPYELPSDDEGNADE